MIFHWKYPIVFGSDKNWLDIKKLLGKYSFMADRVYIYIYIYIYMCVCVCVCVCVRESCSKISKAHPERSAITKYFYCGNTLLLLKKKKLEKSIQISALISVWVSYKSERWPTNLKSWGGWELFEWLSSIYQPIGIMVRVFANGPEDRGSIPGRDIWKTQKSYLKSPCLTLGIIRYGSDQG